MEKHDGDIMEFRINIMGQYHNDAMLPQITEAVRIHGSIEEELINNKTEWNYLTFTRVIVDNGDG
jgi:hypothetical protein